MIKTKKENHWKKDWKQKEKLLEYDGKDYLTVCAESIKYSTADKKIIVTYAVNDKNFEKLKNQNLQKMKEMMEIDISEMNDIFAKDSKYRINVYNLVFKLRPYPYDIHVLSDCLVEYVCKRQENDDYFDLNNLIRID